MEPAAKTGREFGGRAPGLRKPLLGSAAGHALLLAALALLGAAAGPGAGSAVHVILVEGAQFAPFPSAAGEAPGDGSGAEEFSATSPGGAPPGKAARHATVAAARRLPSAVASSNSPSSFAAAASRPSSTEAGNAVTPRAAGPEAAALSGGTARPGSMPREDAAPAASPGAVNRANGDGIYGIGVAGSVAAGTAVLDGPGGEPPEGAVGGRADRAGDGGGTGPLLQKIRAAIVYPEEAIRRGQEGEVLLRIRIGEGGVPREIRVARSSGARMLDRAARDGVVRAAPLPSLPGWFEVPIRFSLR